MKNYGVAFFADKSDDPVRYDPRICETNIWKCMIFNIFTWFQIGNMLNARKVNAEPNFLSGISTSTLYIAVWLFIFVMQVCIVEGLGRASFQVASTLPLNTDQWLMSLGFGACAIVWNAVIQLVPIDKTTQEIKLDSAYAFSRDAMDNDVKLSTQEQNSLQEQVSLVEMDSMGTVDKPGEMRADKGGNFFVPKGTERSNVTEG